MSLNATSPGCGGTNSLPDFVNLPEIPRNITTFYKPNTNETLTSMETCCSPNPVHKIQNGCYLYCEVPGTEGVSADQAQTQASILTMCVKSDSPISATHLAGSGRAEVRLSSVFTFGFVVSLLVSGLF